MFSCIHNLIRSIDARYCRWKIIPSAETGCRELTHARIALSLKIWLTLWPGKLNLAKMLILSTLSQRKQINTRVFPPSAVNITHLYSTWNQWHPHMIYYLCTLTTFHFQETGSLDFYDSAGDLSGLRQYGESSQTCASLWAEPALQTATPQDFGESYYSIPPKAPIHSSGVSSQPCASLWAEPASQTATLQDFGESYYSNPPKTPIHSSFDFSMPAQAPVAQELEWNTVPQNVENVYSLGSQPPLAPSFGYHPAMLPPQPTFQFVCEDEPIPEVAISRKRRKVEPPATPSRSSPQMKRQPITRMRLRSRRVQKTQELSSAHPKTDGEQDIFWFVSAIWHNIKDKPSKMKQAGRRRVRYPGKCPFCGTAYTRAPNVKTHLEHCKLNVPGAAILYSTNGLSIQRLAQAYMDGKFTVEEENWMSHTECTRLRHCIAKGATGAGWDVVQHGRGGNKSGDNEIVEGFLKRSAKSWAEPVLIAEQPQPD